MYTCYSCGNETHHKLVFTHTATLLYEQIYENIYYEPFEYFVYSCGVCEGLLILGGFHHELVGDISDYQRLYPKGPSLVPPPHLLGKEFEVPEKLIQVYEKAWPLRINNPEAFTNQVRRALEYICVDQGANGSNLFRKLQDLSGKGIFPETVADLASQIRIIGNIGSHASETEIDIWDAILIDELFRTIIDYVYIAPSKLERLKERFSSRNT